MTTEQTITLNKLFHSEQNVRRTDRAEGIEALAASIAAHGLRQNLNVTLRADGKGFEVVAGGRRLRALKHLAKAGQIAKNEPVRCLVLAEGDNAAEISLAENAMREAMHPDDQCAAFAALIEQGLTAEEVAARFGVTPAVVQRRLRLAGVSPALRALYRAGDMTLDHMMALALSDDHAAQEAAWAALPQWNRSADALRRTLTGGTVAADSRVARFVTVAAYTAAGGGITRDLFDPEDGGYLTDPALLDRLAGEQLAAVCETIRAEGWKWVEVQVTREYGAGYSRIWPHHAGEPDGEDDEDGDGDDSPGTFDPADMARAGVVVSIGHDGAVQIDRGLVRAEDREAEPATGTAKPKPAPGALAAALVTDLSAHRTAALRDALAGNTHIALAAVVHALALPLVYEERDGSCLALRAASDRLDRHTQTPGDCEAHALLAAAGTLWGDRLPGDPTDLLDWLVGQEQATLLDLLAYLAGLTVSAIETKHQPRPTGADALARTLALDMADHWQPTIEGFWSRVSKAGMAQAMAEAKVTADGALDGVKKAEAARMTARAMLGTRWLPPALREMAA